MKTSILLLLFLTFVFPSTGYSQISDIEKFEHFGNLGYQALQGEQDGDYNDSVYVVMEELVVQPGKRLTFFPGCRILVTKNTRIVVQGHLICLGTKEKPVVFSKLPGDDYYIPIDSSVNVPWYGIEIADSGAIECSYTTITASKYGILAQSGYNAILLDSVELSNNRFSNLSIGKKTILVGGSGKVTYHSTGGELPKFGIANDTTTPLNQPGLFTKGQHLSLRLVSGIASATTALTAVSLYFYSKNLDTRANNQTDRNNADDLWNRSSQVRTSASVLGIAGAMCGIGFTLTFVPPFSGK